METFLLFFRMDIHTPPSAEQLQAYMQQWNTWTDGLAAQNRLEGGNHLSVEGCVLRNNGEMTTGAYTQMHESVAGYLLIKAIDFNDAVRLAKDCPILQGEGTNVEIRKVAGM